MSKELADMGPLAILLVDVLRAAMATVRIAEKRGASNNPLLRVSPEALSGARRVEDSCRAVCAVMGIDFDKHVLQLILGGENSSDSDVSVDNVTNLFGGNDEPEGN